MKIVKRKKPLHLTPSIKKTIRNLLSDPEIKFHSIRQGYNVQIFFRDNTYTKYKNRMWDIGIRGRIETSFYDDDWDLVGYYLDGKVVFY